MNRSSASFNLAKGSDVATIPKPAQLLSKASTHNAANDCSSRMASPLSSRITFAMTRTSQRQRRLPSVAVHCGVRAHGLTYFRPHNTGTLKDLEVSDPRPSPTTTASHHHGDAFNRKATLPTMTPATAPRIPSPQLNLSSPLCQDAGGASCGGMSGVRDMRSNVHGHRRAPVEGSIGAAVPARPGATWG